MLNNVIGLVFVGCLVAPIVLALKKPKAREKRTMKGVELTLKEWQLLASLANYQRVTQAKLMSRIVKEHLADRGVKR